MGQTVTGKTVKEPAIPVELPLLSVMVADAAERRKIVRRIVDQDSSEGHLDVAAFQSMI